MNFKHPILIVDTETGGLNPNHEIRWSIPAVPTCGRVKGELTRLAPPILEIGAMLLSPGTLDVTECFQCVCGPEEGQTVEQLFNQCTEQALKVNGFREKVEELKKAKPLSACLTEFAAWTKKLGKYHLSGQNVRFDMLMINAACRRAGVELELKGPVLELQTLSLIYFGLQGRCLPSISLSKVAKELDVSTEGSHTALADCLMTATCLKKMLLALKKD